VTVPGLRTLTATVLVLVTTFVVGLTASQLAGPRSLPDWLAWLRPAGVTPGRALGPSEPVRIEIPSAGVDAEVRPVGLDRHGAIAAPPLHRAGQAGWYRDGPSPGQYGAAVIVGHVDDRRGPAVFHGVADLSAGSRIAVTRRDGRVTVFQVTGVRTYPKQHLPPDEVYGAFTEPGLRLITCGGPWVGGRTGYADSVVVFATLIDP
jgi:hypothetical protein